MKRLLSVLFILMTFSQLASAQTTPEQYIEKFFAEYKSKGPKEAVANLYATNKWSPKFEEAIENVKTQLSSYDKDLIGEFYGYDFNTKKQLGESYILYSYLVKFDRQPLRFTFKFYKPKDKWVLYSFKFDDSFDAELDKAAEVNFVVK